MKGKKVEAENYEDEEIEESMEAKPYLFGPVDDCKY